MPFFALDDFEGSYRLNRLECWKTNSFLERTHFTLYPIPSLISWQWRIYFQSCQCFRERGYENKNVNKNTAPKQGPIDMIIDVIRLLLVDYIFSKLSGLQWNSAYTSMQSLWDHAFLISIVMYTLAWWESFFIFLFQISTDNNIHFSYRSSICSVFLLIPICYNHRGEFVNPLQMKFYFKLFKQRLALILRWFLIWAS